MKKILFLFLIIPFACFSQIIGSRENGQRVAGSVEPSKLQKGAHRGDVNLFSGTYNHGYTLGTVSTVSGLSYTLELSYSSTFTGGDNLPHTAGIPYGEGWSLNLPTITIEAENYQKYTQSQINTINNNSNQTFTFTRSEAMQEGNLYWFSPYLSIPGVVQGRLVYKYTKHSRALFVLNTFDQYVEAWFTGTSWEVKLSDGTMYNFPISVSTYRNASNQRVYKDQDNQNYNIQVPAVLENLIFPKEEYISWYVSDMKRAQDPMSEKILFTYERFGKFNFFQEFEQTRLRHNMMRGYVMDTAVGYSTMEMYRDVILKQVSAVNLATPTEVIMLEYETTYPAGSSGLLNINDPAVSRLDSLYSYKTVYYWGTPHNDLNNSPPTSAYDNFNSWYRYRHLKSDNVPYNEYYDIEPTNPYRGARSGWGDDTHYYRELLGTPDRYQASFDHSFLESPRIGDDFVPGDIYEVRTIIHNPYSNSGAGFCNFDINLASGSYDGESPLQYVDAGVNNNRVVASGIDTRRKEPIFTTFNQAVKWNTRAQGGLAPSAKNITSNFFVMPNLPQEYNGFHIQIGPGNSDNDFSTRPQDMSQGLSGTPNDPHARFTYFNTKIPNEASRLLKSGDNIPQNFGIGFPWHMMNKAYSYIDNNDTSYSTVRDGFWWNDNLISTLSWENKPTLADETVQLWAVEVRRFSKNPYMLKRVKHYKINGETDGVFDEGKILVAEYELFYRIFSDRYINNSLENTSSDINTDVPRRNIYALSKIRRIPVNPSAEDSASFDIAKAPATSFSYTTFGSLYNFTNYLVSNGNSLLLTEITDELGGVTELEYYSFGNSFGASDNHSFALPRFDNRPASANFTTSQETNKKPPHALQVYAVLKSKTVRNGQDTIEQQWDYEYYTPVRSSTLPSLSEHLTHNPGYRWKTGFSRTIVKEPELRSGGERPYSVYYHEGNDNGGRLFGKLSKVEVYDGPGGRLLSERELAYNNNLAYENGVYRDAFYETQNYHYTDYHSNTSSLLSPPSSTDPPWGRARFYETHFANLLGAGYLNSYFTPKKQEVKTVYGEPYAILPSLNDENNGTHGNTGNGGNATQMSAPGSGGSNTPAAMQSGGGSTGQQNISIAGGAFEPINGLVAGNAFLIQDSAFYQIITDYDYYDASHTGYTDCRGFSILMSNGLSYSEQLYFEPSWGLYSKKTRSPQQPGAFNKEEYFYFYDLINTIGVISSFTEIWSVYHGSIRDIAYQKRVTSKAVNKDSVMRSTYFIYESGWVPDPVPFSDPATIVELDASLCMENDTTVSDTTITDTTVTDTLVDITEPCYRIKYYDGKNISPPSGYYVKCDTGNNMEGTRVWWCEIPDYNMEDAALIYENERCNCENIINNTDYDCGDADDDVTSGGGTTGTTGSTTGSTNFAPGSNLPHEIVHQPAPDTSSFVHVAEIMTRAFMLRSIVEQVDETPSGYNDRNAIMTYTLNSASKYQPTFPFDTLRTYHVHNRNMHGLPTLTEDANGLLTRYEYSEPFRIWYRDTTWTCVDEIRLSMGYNNIGVPLSVTVGHGRTDSLITRYEYHPDYNIKKIIDPNGMEMSYTYDQWGRLREAYRNSERLAMYGYHQWEGDDLLTFKERTAANYVETYTFNRTGSPAALRSRAYIDPLGREHSILSQLSANADSALRDTFMIYSGSVVYDNWNRKLQQYRPFLYTDGGDTVEFALTENWEDNTLPQEFRAWRYEADQRSRVLRESPFGEDIAAGHSRKNQYRLINRSTLVSELALTDAEEALLTEYTDSVYVFRKARSMDEDGKTTYTYHTPLGQKVATMQVIDLNETALTLFIYDSYGNTTQVLNPKKQNSYFRYNPLGWLYERQTVDNGTTRWLYDRMGQPVLEQDAKGAATGYARQMAYDLYGNPVRQERAAVTGQSALNNLDERTSYAWLNYDYPNLTGTAVTEKEWFYGNTLGGDTAAYYATAKPYIAGSMHNQRGRLSQAISYDHSGIPVKYCFYSYNDEGNLRWEFQQFNPNGITVTAPGLGVRIDYPGYTLQNALQTQNIDVNSDGILDLQLHYEYDAWNRIKDAYVNFTDARENGNLFASYNYDLPSGLIKETRYFAGRPEYGVDTILYSYDARDRLTDINSLFYDQSLYFDGNLPGVNGLQATQNYNGNINAITATYTLGYAENDPGNFADATVYGYTYDGINRLTAADAAIGTTAPWQGDASYTYDPTGNVRTLERRYSLPQDRDELAYAYAANSNRLTGISGTESRSYTYDANGNLLSDDSRSMTAAIYGRANLPVQFTLGSRQAQYLYNAGDTRIYKEVTEPTSGAVEQSEFYLKDNSGKDVGILDLNSGEWTWYLYGRERTAKLQPNAEQQPDYYTGNLGNSELVDTDTERGKGVIKALEEFMQKGFAFPDELVHIERPDGQREYKMKKVLEQDNDRNYSELTKIALPTERQMIEMPRKPVYSGGETPGMEVVIPIEGFFDGGLPGGGNEGGQPEGPQLPDPFDSAYVVHADTQLNMLEYYITDHLGNTRVTYSIDLVTFDSAGSNSLLFDYTLENVLDYYPYGKLLRAYVNGEREKFIFNGFERDTESNLDYYKRRNYDSHIIRFIEVDPLNDKFPTLSAYQYASNNPILNVDLDGLEGLSFVGTPFFLSEGGEMMQKATAKALEVFKETVEKVNELDKEFRSHGAPTHDKPGMKMEREVTLKLIPTAIESVVEEYLPFFFITPPDLEEKAKEFDNKQSNSETSGNSDNSSILENEEASSDIEKKKEETIKLSEITPNSNPTKEMVIPEG